MKLKEFGPRGRVPYAPLRSATAMPLCNGFSTWNGDLHSKILDMHPALGPISFIFMQFTGKLSRIIGWRPSGNPGSVPEVKLGLYMRNSNRSSQYFLILFTT